MTTIELETQYHGRLGRAIRAARVAVGAGPETEISWHVVERLDEGERGRYLLVGIGSGDEGWLVAVSAAGEVQTWGHDDEGAHAWWTEVDDELVWAPGSWSRSRLHPLRRHREGDAVVHLSPQGRPVPLWLEGAG